MRKRNFVLGSVVALGGAGFLIWALVSAQDPAPDPQGIRSVRFGGTDEHPLYLDLARPSQGEGPFPAVICLHGGGWVGGSRREMKQTIEVLARRGFVAVAPDYRTAPGHPWPACLDDVRAALRWIRDHASEHRLAANRIGVVGRNAGGHLACLLGATSNGKSNSTMECVQAVVSFAGPTDLTAAEVQSEEVLRRNLVPLLGGPPAEKSELYRQASPLLYTLNTPPPFLLIHGKEDSVVPARQSLAMAEKIRSAGGTAQVMLLEGEGHVWAGPNLTRAIDTMLTFLDRTLKE